MFKNLKRFPYITKNDSKEPKKVLKMVLKTHLEPFREPLKVPPVGQPKNLFSKSTASYMEVTGRLSLPMYNCYTE